MGVGAGTPQLVGGPCLHCRVLLSWPPTADAGLPPTPHALQMVEKDIGFVGEVTSVDPSLLRVRCCCTEWVGHNCCHAAGCTFATALPSAVESVLNANPCLPPGLAPQTLASDGYIPVVASVASDGKGQGLNVNADTAAGEVRRLRICRVPCCAGCRPTAAVVHGTYSSHADPASNLRPTPLPSQIAASLRAEKLILMTDVPGVLRNKDDPSTKVRCCHCWGALQTSMGSREGCDASPKGSLAKARRMNRRPTAYHQVVSRRLELRRCRRPGGTGHSLPTVPASAIPSVPAVHRSDHPGLQGAGG